MLKDGVTEYGDDRNAKNGPHVSADERRKTTWWPEGEVAVAP